MDRDTLISQREKQDWKGAEETSRALLALDPTDPEPWYVLAEALGNQGRHQEAIPAGYRAVALNPTLYAAWCFIANSHAALGQWDGVYQASTRALQIAPDIPFAHWLLSHAMMAQGDWKAAWRSYEYGELIGKRSPRCLGKRWSGERIEGQTLFVWGEQGHGDQIQYARFLKDAKERSGATVIAEWRPGLVGLLSGLADATLAIAPDKMVSFAFDYHVPAMSLPHVLGYGTEDLDGSPYLDVEPTTGLEGKIGVAWKGFAGHGNDLNRSMPDEVLNELASIPNLVAVQPGAACPEWLPSCGPLGDFEATARVLKGLKGLITVDTSTAHLAGALGVPTTMIAPLGHTEARWGAFEKTPWYDSWRIVHARDWLSVLSAVKAAAKDM